MPRIELTDRFCQSAKPNGGPQTDYFDCNTAGLSLRCSDGGRTWSYLFSSPRDGKRSRMTLGTYPATSLAAARGRALEARGLVERGEDPRAAFAARANGALRLSGLLESYLDKHCSRLRSRPAIERRLRKNVIPVIGDVEVEKLHRRDISRALDIVIERGSPVEARRVFEDLRAALRWAISHGDLERSPADGMKRPAASAPGERILSDAEIPKLWSVLPRALARSRACQRIVRLCLVTGQRVGEIAGMRRDELDLRGRLWSLPGARTKNGHPHTVPLSELAMAIVREALAEAGEGDFVFPSADGSLPPHAVAHTITQANKRNAFGLASWSAHDLRRTALTGMARLGIAPIVIGHVANHRTTTHAGVTLAVYSKYTYDAEKRAALDLWAQRIVTIVGA